MTFILLMSASVFGIAVLAALARFDAMDVPGRALHPYNVLGFLFAIIDIDFLSLYSLIATGQSTYFAETMIANLAQVKDGFVFFVLCQTFLIAGIAAVPSLGRKTAGTMTPREVRLSEVRASRICMALCILVTMLGAWNLILVSLQHGSFTYIAGVRQRFFAANPLLLIVVSTIAPAYILFGSRNTLRSAFLAMIPLIPFLMLVGGRSKLLYPLIALAYWVCQRIRIPAIVIYIGAPVLLASLTLFTFISRENGSVAEFPKYLEQSGGITGPLFDGASISMAEIISINIARPVLDRQPWESILGGIMLPIPRSIVPMKPLGASTEFSMTIDLDRWELVKSEWTITGFINLFYDYGYIGALIACFVIAVIWTLALKQAFQSRLGTTLVGPICCLVAYQFIRGDLYIVSQFLWPLLFVLLIYWTVLAAVKLIPPPRRRQVRPRAGIAGDAVAGGAVADGVAGAVADGGAPGTAESR